MAKFGWIHLLWTFDSMIDEAASHSFDELPNGTKMGHIHLQVLNVAATANFYQNVLGFDLMAQMPGAGFLSAGGYHHHIGMNTWRSYSGGVAPSNALGLMDYEVVLHDKPAMDDVLLRLSENQIDYEQQNDTLRVKDPAGIWVKLVLQNKTNIIST